MPQRISYWLKQKEIYECELTNGEIFEPYFVIHRNSILYDEVFNGCLADKLSQVDNLRILNYTFKMLPDTFIVHLNHKSIKGYDDWCQGHDRGVRYKMKLDSFSAVAKKLKGLLVNDYYPHWLRGKYLCGGSFRIKRECERNEVIKSVINKRNNVYYLKVLLFVLIALFILCIVTLLRTKQGEKTKKINNFKKT